MGQLSAKADDRGLPWTPTGRLWWPGRFNEVIMWGLLKMVNPQKYVFLILRCYEMVQFRMIWGTSILRNLYIAVLDVEG